LSITGRLLPNCYHFREQIYYLTVSDGI
jgi:hypothetical protein